MSAQLGSDPATSRAAHLPRARGSWRSLATHRVEYSLDGRHVISFMATLSLSDMLLRSASGLSPGFELRFVLHLDGRPEPLEIDGRVAPPSNETPAGGALVEFSLEDHQGRTDLARYFAEQVVPKLEKATASAHPHAPKVLELAGLYYDLERDDEAVALLRRALSAHKRERALYEALAPLLLAQACDAAALDEVARLATSGLALGESLALAAVRDEAQRRRDQLEHTSSPSAPELAVPPERPAANAAEEPVAAVAEHAPAPAQEPVAAGPEAQPTALLVEARDTAPPTADNQAAQPTGPEPFSGAESTAPQPEGTGDSRAAQAEARLQVRFRELEETTRTLAERSAALERTTRELDERATLTLAQAEALASRERRLQAQAATVENRQAQLDAQAASVDERLTAADEREGRINEEHRALQARAVALAEQEESLRAREQALDEAFHTQERAAEDLSRRERFLAEQQLALPSLEALEHEVAQLREVNEMLSRELAAARLAPADETAALAEERLLAQQARAQLEKALREAHAANVAVHEEQALLSERYNAALAEHDREANRLKEELTAHAQQRLALAERQRDLEAQLRASEEARADALAGGEDAVSLAEERARLQAWRYELESLSRDLEQTRALLGQNFVSQRARSDALDQRGAELKAAQEVLEAERSACESRRQELAAHEQELLQQDGSFRQRELELEKRRDALERRGRELESRLQAAAQRDGETEQARRSVEEMQRAVEARQAALREERSLVPNLRAALQTERDAAARARRLLEEQAEALRALRARINDEGSKEARPGGLRSFASRPFRGPWQRRAALLAGVVALLAIVLVLVLGFRRAGTRPRSLPPPTSHAASSDRASGHSSKIKAARPTDPAARPGPPPAKTPGQ